MKILKTRAKTHGDYREVAHTSQTLKNLWRAHDGFERLSEAQRESLDMIAVKVARILNGNAAEPDHWLDIAGYATLGGE